MLLQSTVNETEKTLFAGVRGSVGDTGVSYVLQVRSKKSKGDEAYDMVLGDDMSTVKPPSPRSAWQRQSAKSSVQNLIPRLGCSV